jgi:SAM-dependent methyltransferase
MACPLCKSSELIKDAEAIIRCQCCGRVYQNTSGVFDMMPEFLVEKDGHPTGWQYWARMQSIYKKWVKTDWSLDAAKTEMALYQDFIERYVGGAGVIMDLGGFWGMNRNWLDASNFYFVVDPDDEEVVSPQMHYLKELYPFYGSRFPFIKGIGEYLPVSSNSVDLVIIQDAFDHFLFPQSVIHECYRVLVKGGRLAIMSDVADGGSQRNLREDIVFVLKRKGVLGLARGAYWKLRERFNPSLNRHGHIREFHREDIKQLLSIFSRTKVEKPGVSGFPHLYFISKK